MERNHIIKTTWIKLVVTVAYIKMITALEVKARIRLHTVEIQNGPTTVDGEKPYNQNSLDQVSSHSG